MRIEALSTLLVAVVWLTAVLCRPRLTAANNLTLAFSSRRPREQPSRGHISRWTEEPLEEPTNKQMTYRDMHKIIREEGGKEGLPVECCPTVKEVIQPIGGRNQEDMYVALYRDGKNVQSFYEISCRPDVLDKPCRFIDRKFSNQSRCVQTFSYSYAIVENPGPKIEMKEHRRHHHKEHHHKEHDDVPTISGNNVSGSGWALDHIMIRSGCSCHIMPKPKKKKIAATKARRTKSKQRQSRDPELDFEM
ncbi:uncharacterized protein [Polyergus mexicanus]|uniref:uncharacterized protein n=1 Tax=Polyergus mexicanus TaxID=615972 RepID=UPI0038B431D5